MSNYKNLTKAVTQVANPLDPNVTARTLNDSIAGMHKVAPNLAQSIQTVGARSLKYLHDQIPRPFNQLVGDSEYEPSKSEQRQWLHIHDIVSDPISVLDHVRHGTLTDDHMNALQAVHPELLQEMREKVMEHMEPEKVQKLPSTTKIALSSFLGSPVTEAMLPQSIMANQQALMPPAMQQPPQKASKSGLKEMNLAQRSSTRTEDLEEAD